MCENICFLFVFSKTWPSTILVVSHDREFLNSVASDILHLHSQRIDAYKGNYEDFCKTRDERLKNQQREYLAQKEYRDNIQVSRMNFLKFINKSISEGVPCSEGIQRQHTGRSNELLEIYK